MSSREYIPKDLKSINNPRLLKQFFEYIQSQKKGKTVSNKDKVLSFAGLLSDKQAAKISKSINENFNSIEGEW